MKNTKVLNIFLVALVILIMPHMARACGCGLALGDMKVFNSLKETQAYLLINIDDEDTYTEMPFFRMVSMDEPYNVTIVFPIDGIPESVDGKTITAEKFLEDYGIAAADINIKEQSWEGVATMLWSDIKQISPIISGLSNGFFGLGASGAFNFGASTLGGAQYDGTRKGISPVASFQFEGGSLDIYDVKSMNTLEEFVKTINITLTGDVQDLVTKYSDYYVAVLHLRVPSAVSEDVRDELSLCPEETAKVKKMLTEKTEFTYFELREISQYDCGESLDKLVRSVTEVNSDVNGTLVIMRFDNTKKFFYPTSIVNSYNYPITEQKYYIKTPRNLHVDLTGSKVDKTANFNLQRWYKVTSTTEDIRGTIKKANNLTLINDQVKNLVQAIYNITAFLALLLFLSIIFIPVMIYRKKSEEELDQTDKTFMFVTIILGGLLLGAITLLFRKKWRIALTLFLIWVIILIIQIMSKTF